MPDAAGGSGGEGPTLLERLRARMECGRVREARAPRSVAIVGNGPLPSGSAGTIDAAEIVVRFNNPRGFPGEAGERLTHLFLINCGGQMEEWLSDPAFGMEEPHRRADLIVLAIDSDASGTVGDPAAGDDRNWTPEAAARLEPCHTVALLPAADFHATRRALLGLSDRTSLAPSTGILAIGHFVRTRRPGDPPILLRGFGFAGWDGHDWAAERTLCGIWAARGWVDIG